MEQQTRGTSRQFLFAEVTASSSLSLFFICFLLSQRFSPRVGGGGKREVGSEDEEDEKREIRRENDNDEATRRSGRIKDLRGVIECVCSRKEGGRRRVVVVSLISPANFLWVSHSVRQRHLCKAS